MGVLGIILIAYLVYLQLHFRVVSVQPADEGSTTAAVVLNFNKELQNPQELGLSLDPAVPGNVSISNKSITFTPNQSYQVDKKYTVKVTAVVAKDGSKIETIRHSFTVKYVEEKDLSEDEQRRAISLTDQLQKENSILAKLPYATSEFKVDYDIIQNSKKENVVLLRITLYPILNRPDQYNTYVAQIKEYKSKAIAWVEQNSGGKLYTLTFDPDVPDQEQPASNDYTGDGVPPEEQ